MSLLMEDGTSVDNVHAQKRFIEAAIAKADQELLKALLRKGAQINDPFQAIECLHTAAEDGEDELVYLLLQNGAAPYVNDVIPRIKDTALHLATRGGHTETVKVLLDHDADVYALTSTRRCTYIGNVEFFVDDNVRALHIAAEEGNYQIVKYLIEKNSEIDAMTEHGYTPLHLAVIENHVDVVKLLLQHRALICPVTDDGEHVIHIARRRGLIHIITIIEEHMVFILTESDYDEEDVAFSKEHITMEPKKKKKKKKKATTPIKKHKPSDSEVTIEEYVTTETTYEVVRGQEKDIKEKPKIESTEYRTASKEGRPSKSEMVSLKKKPNDSEVTMEEYVTTETTYEVFRGQEKDIKLKPSQIESTEYKQASEEGKPSKLETVSKKKKPSDSEVSTEEYVTIETTYDVVRGQEKGTKEKPKIESTEYKMTPKEGRPSKSEMVGKKKKPTDSEESTEEYETTETTYEVYRGQERDIKQKPSKIESTEYKGASEERKPSKSEIVSKKKKPSDSEVSTDEYVTIETTYEVVRGQEKDIKEKPKIQSQEYRTASKEGRPSKSEMMGKKKKPTDSEESTEEYVTTETSYEVIRGQETYIKQKPNIKNTEDMKGSEEGETAETIQGTLLTEHKSKYLNQDEAPAQTGSTKPTTGKHTNSGAVSGGLILVSVTEHTEETIVRVGPHTHHQHYPNSDIPSINMEHGRPETADMRGTPTGEVLPTQKEKSNRVVTSSGTSTITENDGESRKQPKMPGYVPETDRNLTKRSDGDPKDKEVSVPHIEAKGYPEGKTREIATHSTQTDAIGEFPWGPRIQEGIMATDDRPTTKYDTSRKEHEEDPLVNKGLIEDGKTQPAAKSVSPHEAKNNSINSGKGSYGERPIIDVSVESPKKKSQDPSATSPGPFSTPRSGNERHFNTYNSYRTYMQESLPSGASGDREGASPGKDERTRYQDEFGNLEDQRKQIPEEQNEHEQAHSTRTTIRTSDHDSLASLELQESDENLQHTEDSEGKKQESEPLLGNSDDEEYLNDQTMKAAISLMHKKYEYNSDDDSSQSENEGKDIDIQMDIKQSSVEYVTPHKIKEVEVGQRDEVEEEEEEEEESEGESGEEDGTPTAVISRGPLIEKHQRSPGITLQTVDYVSKPDTSNAIATQPEMDSRPGLHSVPDPELKFHDSRNRKTSNGKPKRPSLPKSPVTGLREEHRKPGEVPHRFEYIDESPHALTERLIPPDVYKAQEEEYLRKLGFGVAPEDEMDEEEFIRYYYHNAIKYGIKETESEDEDSDSDGDNEQEQAVIKPGPKLMLPEKPRHKQQDPDYKYKVPDVPTLTWEIETKKARRNKKKAPVLKDDANSARSPANIVPTKGISVEPTPSGSMPKVTSVVSEPNAPSLQRNIKQQEPPQDDSAGSDNDGLYISGQKVQDALSYMSRKYDYDSGKDSSVEIPDQVTSGGALSESPLSTFNIDATDKTQGMQRKPQTQEQLDHGTHPDKYATKPQPTAGLRNDEGEKSLGESTNEEPSVEKTSPKKVKKGTQERREHEVTIRSKSGKKLRKKIKNRDKVPKNEQTDVSTQGTTEALMQPEEKASSPSKKSSSKKQEGKKPSGRGPSSSDENTSGKPPKAPSSGKTGNKQTDIYIDDAEEHKNKDSLIRSKEDIKHAQTSPSPKKSLGPKTPVEVVVKEHIIQKKEIDSNLQPLTTDKYKESTVKIVAAGPSSKQNTDGRPWKMEKAIPVSENSSSQDTENSDGRDMPYDPLERILNRPYMKIDREKEAPALDASEEEIMDAVSGTDQSEIVGKIDSIILASLANVKDKYRKESTEESYSPTESQSDIDKIAPTGNGTKPSKTSVETSVEISTRKTGQQAPKVKGIEVNPKIVKAPEPVLPAGQEGDKKHQGSRPGLKKNSDYKKPQESQGNMKTSVEISAAKTGGEKPKIKAMEVHQVIERPPEPSLRRSKEGNRSPRTNGTLDIKQRDSDPSSSSGSLYDRAISLPPDKPAVAVPGPSQTPHSRGSKGWGTVAPKSPGSDPKRQSLIKVTNLDDYMKLHTSNEGVSSSSELEPGPTTPSSKTRTVSITFIEKTPVRKDTTAPGPRRRILDDEISFTKAGPKGTSTPFNMSETDIAHGHHQKDPYRTSETSSRQDSPVQREQTPPIQTIEIPPVPSVEDSTSPKKKKVKSKGKKKVKKRKDKTDENMDPNQVQTPDSVDMSANDSILAGHGGEINMSIKSEGNQTQEKMDQAETASPSPGGIAATSTPEHDSQLMQDDSQTMRGSKKAKVPTKDIGKTEAVILPAESSHIQDISVAAAGKIEPKSRENYAPTKQLVEKEAKHFVKVLPVDSRSTPDLSPRTPEQIVQAMEWEPRGQSSILPGHQNDTPRPNIRIMPSMTKRRKLDDDDDNEEKEEEEEGKENIEKVNQNVVKPEKGPQITKPSHTGYLLTPAPRQPTKWRNIPKRDESFTGPREAAKKARPTSVPDVYVLAKFDSGSLSNLGVLSKDESAASSSFDPQSSSANNSYQSDPTFLESSTDGPEHYDPYSLRTKSMDELEIRSPLPQGEARNDGLIRSLSGGDLQESDPFTQQWGAAERQAEKSKYKVVVMPDTFFNRSPVARAAQVYRGDDSMKGKPSGNGVQFRGQNEIAFYHTKGSVGTVGSLKTMTTPAQRYHPRSQSVPSYSHFIPPSEPDGNGPAAKPRSKTKSKGKSPKETFNRHSLEVVNRAEPVTTKKQRPKTMHDSPREYHAVDAIFKYVVPSKMAFMKGPVKSPGKGHHEHQQRPHPQQPLNPRLHPQHLQMQHGQEPTSPQTYEGQHRSRGPPYVSPPDYRQVQLARQQQHRYQQQPQQFQQQQHHHHQHQQQQYQQPNPRQQQQPQYRQPPMYRQQSASEYIVSGPKYGPLVVPSGYKKRTSDPTGLRGKLKQAAPPQDDETEIW